jgi:hypothetical protein
MLAMPHALGILAAGKSITYSESGRCLIHALWRAFVVNAALNAAF